VVPLRAGDHDWKVGLETGYFRPGHDLRNDRVNLITLANLQFRQRFVSSSDAFVFQVRFRPEWYGPKRDNYTLAGSLDGQYQKKWDRMSAGAVALIRRNAYYTKYTDVVTNAFSFRPSVMRRLGISTSIEVGVPLSFLLTRTQTETELKLIGPYMRLHYSSSPDRRMFLGIQGEWFSARNQDDLLANRNDGHRFGVELNSEWLRPVFVTINYKLFRHSSELTRSSWEHEIEFVVGKRLDTRWSVFALLDYYRRHVRTSSGLTSTLLFTNTNNERRASMKIVYAVSRHLDVSAKAGYQRNELVYDSVVWSGLQLSAGLEWRP